MQANVIRVLKILQIIRKLLIIIEFTIYDNFSLFSAKT